VLISLVLGVATMLVVAWGAANRYRWNDPARGPIDILSPLGTGWFTSVEEGFGVTCCGSIMLDVTGRGVQANGDAAKIPPAWSIVRRGSPVEVVGKSVPGIGSLLERAAGWPMRAVMERTSSPGIVPMRVPGHDLTARIRRGGDPYDDVALAFMPMWPGFLVDALVYGVVWFGVLWMAGRVRRGRRVRAGLCPVCRYDLKGLSGGVCPECGAAVEARVE
jgi:hypothetical protein